MRMRPARLLGVALIAGALLAACSSPRPQRNPADVRAQIVRLLPSQLADRKGWAADLYTAFDALQNRSST